MDPQTRIKSLSEQGNSVEMEANIPVKRYFRSGMELVKMAAVYEEEGNLESAFILYIRYMTLFLEKIRNHPDYRNYSSADKGTINKKLKEVLPKAEIIKERLKEKYQQEYNEMVAEQKLLEERWRMEEEEKMRVRVANKAVEVSSHHEDGIGRSEDGWTNRHVTPYDGHATEDRSLGDLSYPIEYLSRDPQLTPRAETGGAIVPSHEPEVARPCPVPSRDTKPQPPRSAPSVNRGTKPLSLMSAHHDQKGGKLRTVVVPERLMEIFLKLALSNTSRNIETCGILAGKLASNKFLITYLLLPQQVGTADSCTTKHEEELFDQQDKLDLITLGWIHTHPTQTAFLSSVDLHTHCSYQLMMPEALAIVCAPKFQETGYFTLTQTHGLSYIANCRQNGFHPHPSEPPLFQAADHVQLDPHLSIKVVDLRR